MADGVITASPLYWPPHFPRTPGHRRERSRFQQTPGNARQHLIWEIERLGGRNIILSTNTELRRDGLPYASQRRLDDPGVAAWFTLGGVQQCIPCDRWHLIKDNMHAIELSIAALRGLDRWGAKSMVEAAFKGFAALPAPGVSDWRNVLGNEVADRAAVERRYRELARERHPDHGGSDSMMADLNTARDAALRELS